MNPGAIPGLHTVLVATDLTHSGSCALRYAMRIAQLQGAMLVVVHGIDPVGYAFPEGIPAPSSNEIARQVLEKIEQESREQGIQVHSMLEAGSIYERILQAVRSYKADLLVLGTRSPEKIGSEALGTVARRLIATAPCPVLTVPAACESEQPAGHWSRVLVATDFSPASRAALHFAQTISGGQVVVVHATRETTTRGRLHHLERLQIPNRQSDPDSAPVEHIVIPGEAPRVIAEEAERQHADIVVLGAPDKILSDADFPNSTVLQVISSLKCPVLCVPPNRTQAAAGIVRQVAFPA